MKKYVLLAMMLFVQSAFAGKPKMLIVGDSWATFMCLYGSFKTNLRKFGYVTRIRGDRNSVDPARRRTRYDYHVGVEGCGKTEKAGATAEDFLKDKFKNKVVSRLENDQDIKMVFISLGGNDLIDGWHADMNIEEEYELFDTVLERLYQVVAYIKEASPNVKIVVSNYDYPNFEKSKLRLKQKNL